MKRDTWQKSSPFLRKRLFLLDISFHFWPFVLGYGISSLPESVSLSNGSLLGLQFAEISVLEADTSLLILGLWGIEPATFQFWRWCHSDFTSGWLIWVKDILPLGFCFSCFVWDWCEVGLDASERHWFVNRARRVPNLISSSKVLYFWAL